MFLLLAMVIIGGRRSLAGCVIGAVALTVVQQELINLAAYAQLGYGLVVVLWWCSRRPASPAFRGGCRLVPATAWAHPGRARRLSHSGRFPP